MKTYVGIEIGGTKIQVVAADADAHILERFRYPVDPSAGAMVIRKNVEDALQRLSARPTCIGVGFGGPVDRKTSIVQQSFHVDGWAGFNLGDWLRSFAGVPIVVDNDANVAALGEATHGAGREHHIVMYVTLGSGVGAGLVIGGNLYHGAIPGELELGHIRLEKNGKTVQDSCSGWAVNEKIRTTASRLPQSPLAVEAKKYPGSEARALAHALVSGDAEAQKILHETADDLAFGLSHAVHLLNPDTVILGGGLSLVGECLRSAVSERLVSFLMEPFRPGPALKLALLKEDTVPIGAIALAKGIVS